VRKLGPQPPIPPPAVAGARGTIDDDEHLDAYNAYLARLNQPGPGPAGKKGRQASPVYCEEVTSGQ
jgi:hypothetical protein